MKPSQERYRDLIAKKWADVWDLFPSYIHFHYLSRKYGNEKLSRLLDISVSSINQKKTERNEKTDYHCAYLFLKEMDKYTKHMPEIIKVEWDERIDFDSHNSVIGFGIVNGDFFFTQTVRDILHQQKYKHYYILSCRGRELRDKTESKDLMFRYYFNAFKEITELYNINAYYSVRSLRNE